MALKSVKIFQSSMGWREAQQVLHVEYDAPLFYDWTFEPLPLQLSCWLTSGRQLLMVPTSEQLCFPFRFPFVPSLSLEGWVPGSGDWSGQMRKSYQWLYRYLWNVYQCMSTSRFEFFFVSTFLLCM